MAYNSIIQVFKLTDDQINHQRVTLDYFPEIVPATIKVLCQDQPVLLSGNGMTYDFHTVDNTVSWYKNKLVTSLAKNDLLAVQYEKAYTVHGAGTNSPTDDYQIYEEHTLDYNTINTSGYITTNYGISNPYDVMIHYNGSTSYIYDTGIGSTITPTTAADFKLQGNAIIWKDGTDEYKLYNQLQTVPLTGSTTVTVVYRPSNYNAFTTRICDSFILDSIDVSGQQLTLSDTPLSSGAIEFQYEGNNTFARDVDFTVSGNIISWSGLSLSGLLSVGNRVRLTYYTQPSNKSGELKPIMQYATNTVAGLCPRLRTTVRYPLVATSTVAVPSEQAIREAITNIQYAINYQNKNTDSGRIYDHLSAWIEYQPVDPTLIAQGITTHTQTRSLKHTPYFSCIEVSGTVYNTINSSSNIVNLITKTENEKPSVWTIEEDYYSYCKQFLEEKSVIEGGEHQYKKIVPESEVSTSGYTITSLVGGDLIGKIFIKTHAALSSPAALYSLGLDENKELFIHPFNISGDALTTGPVGLVEKWHYGNGMIPSGFYYVDEDHHGSQMKIYNNLTSPLSGATGKIGVSVSYGHIDWEACANGYIMGDFYGKPTQRIIFNEDLDVFLREDRLVATSTLNYVSMGDYEKAYIQNVGGLRAGVSTNKIIRYKPHLDVKENLTHTLVTPRYDHCGQTIENYMYVAGGVQRTAHTAKFLNTIERGTSNDANYTLVGTLITQARSGMGSSVMKDRMYMFGGEIKYDYTDVQSTNPTFINIFPTKLPDVNYTLSGYGTSGTISGTVDFIEYYSPLEDVSVLMTTKLSYERANVRTFGVQNSTYILNGNTRVNTAALHPPTPVMHNIVELYNSLDGTITVLNPMPVKLACGSAVNTSTDGYYCGGISTYTPSTVSVNIIQKLEFATNTWSIGNSKLINTVYNQGAVSI